MPSGAVSAIHSGSFPTMAAAPVGLSQREKVERRTVASTTEPASPRTVAASVAERARRKRVASSGVSCPMVIPTMRGPKPVEETYVAGVAGLVISANPDLTAVQVQDVITRSAVDMGTRGWDPAYGWGRLDAAAAVQLALGRR